MASTVFKTSCGLFWIIWMVGLSSLFGMQHIQRQYTFLTSTDRGAELMYSACVLTTCMAFIGCCCVKFDVSNICCAFCYLMGFMCGLLTICVLLFLVLQSSSTPHPLDVLRRVFIELNESGNVPRFLHSTQIQYHCCGIYGFKDYRAFLLEGPTTRDVPHTCCKNQTGFPQDICYPHSSAGPNATGTFPNSGIYLSDSNLTLPIPLPTRKGQYEDFVMKYVRAMYGDDVINATELERYGRADLQLPVDPIKAKSLNLKGCFVHLKANTDGIRASYSEFSIVLLAAGVLMAILFVQNCLKARKRILEARGEVTGMALDALPEPDILEKRLSSQSDKQVLVTFSSHSNKKISGIDPEDVRRLSLTKLAAKPPRVSPPQM